jgi:hypothetical protein
MVPGPTEKGILMSAYILRFQETIPIEDGSLHEEFISQSLPFNALAEIVAGTRTITEVKREPGDNDPVSRHLRVLPVS